MDMGISLLIIRYLLQRFGDKRKGKEKERHFLRFFCSPPREQNNDHEFFSFKRNYLSYFTYTLMTPFYILAPTVRCVFFARDKRFLQYRLTINTLEIKQIHYFYTFDVKNNINLRF